MDRGLRAHLSPNEESVFRRIAAEATDQDKFQPRHLAQLAALRLVELRDGKWRLTTMGSARNASEVKTSG